MSLQIRRLCYALGAEVIGIDLRQPVDDPSFSDIHRAYLEYSVLLFREQRLTREQHIAFSRRFGTLDTHEALSPDRHPDHPEILLNCNRSQAGVRSGFGYGATLWHSDKTRGASCNLATATLLRSVTLPEVGGDTLFTNLYLAYETLSDVMKRLIGDLYGAYPRPSHLYDKSTPERLAATQRLNPPDALPLVIVHPETGRKALCIGEKVKQLVGMTTDESQPLVQFLLAHATQPQFVYRHQWQPHDLLMWDSRCTNHRAVGDYDHAQLRELERTTVMGTPTDGYPITEPMP